MNEKVSRSEDVLKLLRRAPGKRPQFLRDSGNDHLFAMIIELATQLSVLRERVYVHESLGARRVPVTMDSVEAWEPSPTEMSDLSAIRRQQLEDLFRTVLARETGDEICQETEDPSPPS